jgi:hypothetical protein
MEYICHGLKFENGNDTKRIISFEIFRGYIIIDNKLVEAKTLKMRKLLYKCYLESKKSDN